MLDHKAIGQRIRLRRLELNLSQEEFAEIVDISPSFVGAIERGEKSATIDTFDAIISALGVSWDYLMHGVKKRCDKEDCQLYKDAVALLKQYGMDGSGTAEK